MKKTEPVTVCPYQMIEELQEANQRLCNLVEELIGQRDLLASDCKEFREYAAMLGKHAMENKQRADEFHQKYVAALERNNQLRRAVRTIMNRLADRLPMKTLDPIYQQLAGSLRTTD